MKRYTPMYFFLLVVGAMFATGYLLYDILPDQIPIHWNVAGEIDNYMAKPWGVFLFPIITFAVALVFPFLHHIDPKRENYALFKKAWISIQSTLILFFAYLYFVTMLITLKPEYQIIPFVMTGIGVLFIMIGNYLGKIRQNYFVGIKTPWTLANEDVWNKTHRVGGWCFVVSGIVLIINGLLQVAVVTITLVAMVLAIIFPLVYSYLISPKKIDKLH